MVLPADAFATSTGFGPMLQPSPSTSEYSCSVACGSVSPTLIMYVLQKRKTAHIVGRFCVRRQAAGKRQIVLDDGSLFNQARGDPVLGLRDRTAFRDLDDVTQLVHAIFVMGVVLAGLGHDLAVELVLDTTLDQHGHGLGALVADDLADQGALEGFFSFRHVHSLLGGLLLLLGKNGLGTSDVAARHAQLRQVAQLLRGLLHAKAEMGLLQVLDFGLQASHVFFAQGHSLAHLGGLLGSGCHVHVLLDQVPSWRATKVVRSGSLAAARRNASRASSSGTPTIS